MATETLLLLTGAFIGGFVNGLAGFGTALFALGFWLQVLPPQHAVAMALITGLATGLQGLWLVRREIAANRRRLARFLLPALVGIPAGTAVLGRIDASALRLTIAGFMVLYGLFFILRRRLPAFTRPTPLADAGIGLAGGVLGGLAGLSGALPVMWCALRPWTRQETRAVLQPFNTAVLLVSAGSLATKGVYTSAVLSDLLLAVPAGLIAAQAGLAVFRRIGNDQFRWLIVALMLTSGLGLVARELAVLT